MSLPDAINAFFEGGSGIMVIHSIYKVWKDRQVRGVSIPATLFFNAFGVWNTYFYSHLHQWLSLFAGLTLAGTNTILSASIIYFVWKEHNVQFFQSFRSSHRVDS